MVGKHARLLLLLLLLLSVGLLSLLLRLGDEHRLARARGGLPTRAQPLLRDRDFVEDEHDELRLAWQGDEDVAVVRVGICPDRRALRAGP